MRKRVISILGILLVLVAVLGIYIFRNELEELGANNKVEDLKAYYGLEAGEVALIYNGELQSAKAVEQDGIIYLPLDWVSSILNDKFYWSKEDELLIYTTPDSVLYSNYTTVGENKNNLLIKKNDQPYIAGSVVLTYTDILYNIYDSEDAKRVFINDKFTDYLTASTAKKIKIRSGAGFNHGIVKSLGRGENLELVLDDISDENLKSKSLKWVKVSTSDGYVGYVKKTGLHNFMKAQRKSDFKPFRYTSISLNSKVVLAWHQITNKESNAGFDSLIANTQGVNVVSPTWFSLSDNKGNYSSFADKSYVDKAHRQGIQVWALIDNFSKDISTLEILSSTEARKNLISNLINDANTLGLDGINIDFETLKQETAKHYIQFIRELSVEMRNNGLILSVDNPNYASFNQFYRRDRQAEVVDYIINMGYDEHYSGSEPGSVASISFVRNAIDDTLKEVPKEKLINAIPVYTRVWTDKGSKALGIKAAKEWVEKNSINLTWNDELGQYYGEGSVEGVTSYIWMEEEKSLGLKIDYAIEKDIAGAAVWKLGLEPDSVWEVISKIKEQK